MRPTVTATTSSRGTRRVREPAPPPDARRSAGADPGDGGAGHRRNPGPDAWIRSRRGPKIQPDPNRPIDHFREEERRLDGSLLPVLTVLLAGAECPFTCLFCDLWRRTLDGQTPHGAIPRQLDAALQETGPLPAPCAAKLYNASNFFDPRAVPPDDDAAIAARLQPFDRVTVECHPRLVGQRCLEFADRLAGRLEVAMGLETADAEVLARLNKGMTIEDFDRAAATLTGAGIGLRAFVLLPAPFVPQARAAESTLRAVRHAVARGAGHVSLIPTRPGNGALDNLRAQGAWKPPAPRLIEAVAARCAGVSGAVVTVDLWDIERRLSCPSCGPQRTARLRRFNRTGRADPPPECPACASSS